MENQKPDPAPIQQPSVQAPAAGLPPAHGPSLTGNPPREAFEQRIEALFHALRHAGRPFDTAIIIDRINQYYFTGTMQNGLLVLRRDGSRRFFVRKSARRARIESPLPIIEPMTSYRDMLQFLPADLGSTFIETQSMTVSVLESLRKHFTLAAIHPLDAIISRLRAIKSSYELDLMRESGRQHSYLLQSIFPTLLHEGMSEADLIADLYAAMVKLGYHGVSRFAMFQMEMIAGQICFGESSIFPTMFNGPGGTRGQSPAVPALGSRERRLRRGDIVFADIGYGVNGYHTDKTQVYCFGAPPPAEAVAAHRACLDVLRRISERLTVGAVPAEIYQSIMASLPAELERNFMGIGRDRVPFLGHGVGLQIDEYPVIANGFNAPLKAGMVLAIEPKRGLEGIGMVGGEETYLVTPDGPVCLTGGAFDIIQV